jgi:hypothetical protein
MPYYIPATLQTIADQVFKGEQPAVPVRMLLSWFGAQRRSISTIRTIREALGGLKLTTDPEIEAAYIDGLVRFRPIPKSDGNGAGFFTEGPAIPAESGDRSIKADSVGTMVGVVVDPTYRIGRLASANRRPVSAAGRARIAAAQRARWAKAKGRKVVSIETRKRTMSPAARKRIVAAQKARWAKWRKAQKAG